MKLVLANTIHGPNQNAASPELANYDQTRISLIEPFLLSNYDQTRISLIEPFLLSDYLNGTSI